MAIRVVCKFCGSKIDANDSLLGQIRKCPKCKNDILIEPHVVANIAVPKTIPVPSSIEVDQSEGIGFSAKCIFRLNPLYLYVIVGYDRVMAYWKPSDGWQFNAGTGFFNAKRNNSSIPEQGTFAFIEGVVEETENGQRLIGIRFFELTGRAVLVPLGRSDTEILDKLNRKSSLNADQKRFFLQFIRQNYFSEFTADAPEIIDFLTNQDFHSREVGKVEDREVSPLEQN